jgi:phosphoenolpyruvate synthase/pyruvate phosphate dikinase
MGAILPTNVIKNCCHHLLFYCRGLQVGVAGAHAGEPLSIAFLDRAGVDFLVCSPCEVPAAKVAAAQAAIRADLRKHLRV